MCGVAASTGVGVLPAGTMLSPVMLTPSVIASIAHGPMVYLRSMLCQRCGNCCFTMDVIIMCDTAEGLRAVLKPGHEACPHLSFDGATASCAVHERPEYVNSPCWVYGNSDIDPDFIVKRGRPCMVGQAVIEQGGLCKLHPRVEQVPLIETFEVLGWWPDLQDESV